jgi:uncharacterized protein YcbX
VAELFRYPVKSMLGEAVDVIDFMQSGVFGDRAHALIDASTGKVVSAKNPKRWPKMLDFRAVYTEPPRPKKELPPVRMTLPNGSIVSSQQDDVERVLTEALGRAVTLATNAPAAPTLEEYWPDMDDLDHRDTVTDEAMPSETFFDCAAVHLLTTATLDELQKSHTEGRFEIARFRPNVVIKPADGEEGFVENGWIGGTLAIGADVRLQITGPCPRCVMTTLPQGDLPRDTGILRTAAQKNEAKVGVYASVLQGGTVRRGDVVRIVR